MGHLNLESLPASAHNLAHEDVDPHALAAAAVEAVHNERAAAGVTAEWKHGGHALTAEAQHKGGVASGAAKRAKKSASRLSQFLFTSHGQPLGAIRTNRVSAAMAECHLKAANFPAMAARRNRLKLAAPGHHGTNRFIDGGSHCAIGTIMKQGTYRDMLTEQFEMFEANMTAHQDIGPLYCGHIVRALDAGQLSGSTFQTANMHLEELNGKRARAEAERLRAASDSARASSSASSGAASASMSSAYASARASSSASSGGASVSATSASDSARASSSTSNDAASAPATSASASACDSSSASSGAAPALATSGSESACASSSASPAGARYAATDPGKRLDDLRCTYGRAAGYRRDLKARTTSDVGSRVGLVLATAEAELQKIRFKQWKASVSKSSSTVAFLCMASDSLPTACMAVVPVALARSRNPTYWTCLADVPASHASLYNAVQFFRCGDVHASRTGGAIVEYSIYNRKATMYGMNAIWAEYASSGEEISAHCDVGVGGRAPHIEKRLLDRLFQGERGNFLLASEGHEHAAKLYNGNLLPDDTVVDDDVVDRICGGVAPPAFAFLTFSMTLEKAQELRDANKERERKRRLKLDGVEPPQRAHALRR